MSFGDLVIGIGANTATLQSDMDRAKGIVSTAVADINVSINRVGSGANFSGVTTQVEALKGSFASLQGVIAGAFGVGIGLGALKEAANLADEYQNVSNRIQTTVSNAKDLADIQAKIFTVAQQTGAALDDTAKMYQRLEQSIQGSGKSQADSQKEAIALTKTLNQEIVVSGASTGEASRAIMDLVHGLSGGVLHAQQLRPIMRQMPDLAHQIAEGLGVSAKQFEAMVHAGLPAEAVLKAIENQAVAIDVRFSALPKTFARVWQELTNAVEQYIGKASQASAVSELVKNSISGIATHINAVATAAETAAIAMAAWLGGKALTAIGSMVVSLKELIFAQGAYKTAAILAAEGDVAAATASKTALAATIARIDAQNDLRISELAGVNARVASLAVEIAALEKEAVAGNNVLASTERLIAARAELAVATTRVAEVEGVMAAAQNRATLAEQAETVATAQLSASKVALSAATAEATAVSGLFTRAGAGLLAMVGGIPSLVIAAGAALVYLYSTESTLEEQTRKLIAATKELNDAHGDVAPAAAKVSQALYEQARATEELTNKRIAALQKQMEEMAAAGSSGQAIAALSKEMTVLTANEAASEKAAGDLAGALLKVKAVAAGNWLSNFLAPDIKVSLAAVDSFNAKMAEMGDRFKEQAATYKQGHAAALQYKIDQELAAQSVGKSAAQIAILRKELQDGNVDALANARALDAVTAASKNHGASVKQQNAAISSQIDSMKALTEYADKLANKIDDSLAGKAYAKYNEAVKRANDLAEKALIDGNDLNKIIEQQNIALQANADSYAQDSAAIGDFDTVMQSLHDTYQHEEELAGLSTEARRVAIQVEKAEADALKELQKIYGPLARLTEEQTATVKEATLAHIANVKAIDDAKKAQEEWQAIATSGFASVGKSIADFATGGIKNWHDFGQSLLGDAKQFIAQIIEQFLKLKVFNGIIGGLFGGSGAGGGGGGYGGLISAGVAAFAGGSSGGGGGSMDTSSVIGGLVNSSVQGSGFSLFSPSSWMQSGRNLFQGFSQGSANAGSTMFGTWSGTGGSVQQVGGLGVNMPSAGAGTYTPSALGYGAAAVGGIYAGVNEYNAVGGGLRGVGAGIGYGVGTAALSLGLGSLAAGGTFAAGIGATAGTASALGASSGVAAAVPIIGWVALIAMVVDHFTGGKIFGSGWKPKDSTSNIALGADGATVTNSATMWRYQSQLSQSMGNFGGLLSPSDWGKKDWKTENIAITPEQQKAADDFYKSIKQIMTDDAKALAIETPPMIEAALRTVNTYTKKGKVESTKIFVDMLGQSWEEATTALAAQRISVEAQIATIGASSKGKGASDIAQQWRSNLDTLTDGAGALMGMTLDLTKGFKLLGVASTATLADVVKFTQGFKAGSETLSAAYQRLEQANAAYQSFVGQFKPSAVYVDQFEQALSNINTTMKANIAQANALAKAAGAEGATVEDLVNIHQSAAAQMVQLVLQLEDSAQSLAFALGLTDKGSLAQINEEISRLQGGANSATTAVNGYSAAVTNSSQAATAAIALLLGTLSPLSDAQKLQKALDGQRAGTVTPDQVLQIGRQLYASSEAYTRLFAQVQSIGDRTGQTGSAAGASSAISSVSSSGHSLDALIKERDLMQAAQTASQYKTLAQQIAEIAAAKGQSFAEVMKDMGVKQADLEKGLGLKSDAELKTYITNIQKQTDSNKDNTMSIVNELRLILDAIRNPRLGGPDANTPGHSNRVPGSTTTVVDLSPTTINNIGERIARGGLGRSTRPMPMP